MKGERTHQHLLTVPQKEAVLLLGNEYLCRFVVAIPAHLLCWEQPGGKINLLAANDKLGLLRHLDLRLPRKVFNLVQQDVHHGIVRIGVYGVVESF